ncbi:response regulator [Blastopirellula sp. JC732]|uniref:Response regulator n=1 Tax=Blastopirellula sediminis TaxID=2894196 RepID=A0A9X1SGC3_9BACT|nr:response regulator [Blastopirellula sediminis]MCC9606648.1 response regulator [Blastopirellula sediminis]MCC9630055.1 response regulator [Blastopirellula sediminis]
MTKKVLDVGNCGPDFYAIKSFVEKTFDAKVLQADGPEDALEILRREPIALVLVNRKLDRDYTDGLEVIKQIKADAALASVPAMLITNYEEHQQLAISEGAIHGFGKLSLHKGETVDLLKPYLG